MTFLLIEKTHGYSKAKLSALEGKLLRSALTVRLDVSTKKPRRSSICEALVPILAALLLNVDVRQRERRVKLRHIADALTRGSRKSGARRRALPLCRSLDVIRWSCFSPRSALRPPKPISGASATVDGEPFNRPGVEALYLARAPQRALEEYRYGAKVVPPATLAAYKITLDDVPTFLEGSTRTVGTAP